MEFGGFNPWLYLFFSRGSEVKKHSRQFESVSLQGANNSRCSRSRWRSRKGNYGQGMTEYIVIVALIAIASIAAISFFGNAVQASFGGLANVLGGGNADTGRASAAAAGKGAVADSQKKHSLTDFDK